MDNKRDKALSVEIVNNQPLFNLQIQFGDSSDYAIIPKLSEGQKFILFQKASRGNFNYLLFNIPDFGHIPSELIIYYTTLSGEKIKRMYRIDEKGQVSMVKEQSIAIILLPLT